MNEWYHWQDRGGSLTQQMEAARKERLTSGKEETKSIADMFAEVLAHLEDAACWLAELNFQFGKLYPDDMDPKDPAAPFWYAVHEATEPLSSVYDDLEAVGKCVPITEEVTP